MSLVIPTPVPSSDTLLFKATALAAFMQSYEDGNERTATEGDYNRAAAEFMSYVKPLAEREGMTVIKATQQLMMWANERFGTR